MRRRRLLHTTIRARGRHTRQLDVLRHRQPRTHDDPGTQDDKTKTQAQEDRGEKAEEGETKRQEVKQKVSEVKQEECRGYRSMSRGWVCRR